MQNYTNYESLLKDCIGVKIVEKQHTTNGNYNEYYLDEDTEIKVPNDVFIKIIGTSTNGTIGKLVSIEPKTYTASKLSSYSGTYILQIGGRKQLTRINASYGRFLNNFTGTTNYVRNVKKHKKKSKKNPINKFKQELHVGDWVFGTVGKTLRVGRITRWTEHTAWGTMSDDLKDRRKEFRFEGVTNNFKIDDVEAFEQLLTFATLKGWKGH